MSFTFSLPVYAPPPYRFFGMCYGDLPLDAQNYLVKTELVPECLPGCVLPGHLACCGKILRKARHGLWRNFKELFYILYMDLIDMHHSAYTAYRESIGDATPPENWLQIVTEQESRYTKHIFETLLPARESCMDIFVDKFDMIVWLSCDRPNCDAKEFQMYRDFLLVPALKDFDNFCSILEKHVQERNMKTSGKPWTAGLITIDDLNARAEEDARENALRSLRLNHDWGSWLDKCKGRSCADPLWITYTKRRTNLRTV
ncbi:hypothetical protein BJ138DRAFT_1151605, partial [Hygrophoropsis aurantiaca]